MKTYNANVAKGTHKVLMGYKTREEAQMVIDSVFDGKGYVTEGAQK